MKGFVFMIFTVLSIFVRGELVIYGFSNDGSHFAFAYEPKDPMALSGGLKILSTSDNKLSADTLLDEFNDGYSSLSDVTEFFKFHFKDVLGFSDAYAGREFCGNAQDGRIIILGLRTQPLTYTVSKSLNEFGYYDYATSVKYADVPPKMMKSKLSDVYGAYLFNDTLCVMVVKGLVTGFEGAFVEDYDCFAVRVKREEIPDSLYKMSALMLNVEKVRNSMNEYFSEYHEIYPNNTELLSRYGKVMRNPFSSKNDGVAFFEKLPKYSAKHLGTVAVVVDEERESYKMFTGESENFEEVKEE